MKKKRTHNLGRIKQHYSYFIPEICDLLNVHKNTVRQWLRRGLTTIDDGKPFLIHGTTLKAFLAAQQSARKQSCQPDQFYCCKCRKPSRLWGRIVDVVLHSGTIIKLSGLCEQCGCRMHKTASLKNIAQIAATFEIQTVSPLHLIETLPPSVKCYLQRSLTA